MSKEQNLKAVPYQDILDVRSELIKLRSWQKSLVYLDEFFDGKVTRNKKDMRMRYYSCQQLYQVFSGDFEEVLKESEEIVARMVQRGKVQ
ncbi:hypothetical protein BCR24_02505 [Enterococcus ureilyticus]|uniref:Uncharacterized protein n=1 Tax=Enterococcus ureilyticus TaxID=1131292 RepID=A0A1E5HD01_9ENTE|nr:hypothetical protein [Enterococcus ureilyticus]MBM7687768.1 hypothetical protein [Enterococcus ureilyticus]OEG22726.1 hypothetical protein BCR24_02505 [Enterococcus ureilyticus]